MILTVVSQAKNYRMYREDRHFIFFAILTNGKYMNTQCSFNLKFKELNPNFPLFNWAKKINNAPAFNLMWQSLRNKILQN